MQLLLKGFVRFIVDDLVVAQSISQPVAFFCTSGNAHSAAAFGLGNLPGNTANATSCGIDDKQITLLGLAYIHNAKIGGHTRGAEATKILMQLNTGIRLKNTHQIGTIGNTVLLPGSSTHNNAANGILIIERLHHRPHDNTLHRLTQRHGRQIVITRPLIHPLAKTCIQAQIQIFDQELTALQTSYRLGINGKVRRYQVLRWSAREQYTSVHLGHMLISMFFY